MDMTLAKEFANKTILVIGDVMIDSYIWGKVERISPEAPVPIVEVERRENRLGGAANVALNIKSLGAKPILVSVLGRDDKYDVFLKLLEDHNLSKEGILQTSEERKTTVKFRVIGNNVQLLRVDEESTHDIDSKDTFSLLERVKFLFDTKKIDAIIFQDYDKGILTSDVIDNVIQIAQANTCPILVDPKKKHFFQYKNVTLFKPNFKEFKEALNKPLTKEIPQLIEEIKVFRQKQGIKYFLLTLGENGMLISYDENKEEKYEHIPSEVRQVADVSGAGDTVIAVSALGLASGLDPVTTARLSNIAAGIVCEYVGVVPVNPDRFYKKVFEYYGL